MVEGGSSKYDKQLQQLFHYFNFSPESLKSDQESRLGKGKEKLLGNLQNNVDFLYDLWPGSMFSDTSNLKIYLNSKRGRLSVVIAFVELAIGN